MIKRTHIYEISDRDWMVVSIEHQTAAIMLERSEAFYVMSKLMIGGESPQFMQPIHQCIDKLKTSRHRGERAEDIAACVILEEIHDANTHNHDQEKRQ